MRAWPLVGRDAELETIGSAFAATEVAGVVIAGAAGVGKTRLAREALIRLGCRIEWVGATRAGASIPFGAVAHLLPDDWLPRGDSLAVIQAVVSQLRGWGGRRQVAIGVDDAHLLDDRSAAVIAHLAANDLAFLVITIRSGEPVADVLVRLWKDESAQRLDLDRLPPPAVDRLLDQTLRGDIEGLSRRSLHRAAAGNPLALSELLRGGIAAGALRQRYGVWRWEGGRRTTGPVAELVADRLHNIDTAIRPVLELVACGEPLSLALLEQLVDPAAIGAAEDSGMVVVERAGGRTALRLAHPLYGDVLRAALPASRARAVWRQLAGAALARPMRRRDDALRTAVWQVEAGAPIRPDVLRAGARQAVDRSDLALAERLARAARDAAPSPEADCLLAEILEYRGLSDEAATVLPPEPPPPGPGRAQWAVALASTHYWGAGQAAEAERVLDLAADGPGDDLVESQRCWVLLFDGRCAEALPLAGRILARPDAGGQAVIWAAAAGTAAAGFLGRMREAAEIHARGLAVANVRRDLPWGTIQIGCGLCLAHLAGGDLTAAWAVADAGYRTAVEEHAPLTAPAWAGFRGLVEALQGRPATASASLREAIAALEQNDTYRFVRNHLAALAMVTALTGRTDEAKSWMDRSDRLANGANRLFWPWIELARAWTVWATGAAGEAIAVARRAAELARAIRVPTVEAFASYDVLRLGGSGDPARLVELAGSLGTPFAAALAKAAAAHRARDADALVAAAAAFEELGHRLLAAETMASAGRAYRRAGKRGSANLHVEKAVALRERCEGANTPMLGHDDLTELLTPREREILLLAVHHPSRQIANRLGLSSHTVNNNLARAYTKLGVSGRAELRALLNREGSA